MTVTKAQIIDAIQDNIGYPRNQSAEIIEALLEIIKQKLQNGEDIMISGFGKFSVKNKKDRRGRNPATGKDLMLSKRKVITFKCSSRLREKVNGKE